MCTFALAVLSLGSRGDENAKFVQISSECENRTGVNECHGLAGKPFLKMLHVVFQNRFIFGADMDADKKIPSLAIYRLNDMEVGIGERRTKYKQWICRIPQMV